MTITAIELTTEVNKVVPPLEEKQRESSIHVEASRKIDVLDQTELSEDDWNFLNGFPADKKKKVVRKVDVRLIPLLTLLYLFSFIDRANIGNAKVEGLVTDLGLSDAEYNSCLSIFFVPYILFEIPSNHYLNKMKRPSIYIASIIVAWGTVMTMAGLVQNFLGLFFIRFFLGVTESGFFPGAILIISKWYLPNETQVRIAIFYTASAMAGAFSGMLAAGIAQMDGIAGVAGWRWIFILEGIFTVVLGVMTYFCLIDTPALSSRWLEPDEIRYLELRQRADPSRRTKAKTTQTSSSDTRKALWSVLTDWQIWMHGIIYWSNTVPNNALKFTMPTIIQNMGFTRTNSQLLTIPPYCIGAVSAFTASLFADRFSWRMPFIVGPQLIVITAYAILASKAVDIKNNIPACYFGVCLACLGLYPINPCGNAWNLNNLAGPTKRAMGIAFMLCIGNVGGIIGSYIYMEKEKPRYTTGFGTSLAFAAAGVVACFTIEGIYKRINMKRSEMTEEEIAAKYTAEELESMGDRSPLFRYTL